MEDTNDVEEGKRKRDEGIANVLANAGKWIDAAAYAAIFFVETANTSFTGEDIRRAVLETPGVGDPHHHNAWGGLIRRLLVSGVIKRNGERTPMTTVSSHGRLTDRYVKNNAYWLIGS